jgi:transposase
VETKRWHLLWKICQGWTIKKSAEAVGINYDYGKEILKKYNQEGEKGVKNLRKNQRKSGGGRRKLLNNLQLEKLALDLESPPRDGGIWTGPKVASWIEKETSLEKVWNQRGWDYLKKQKYSWQNPRPKHKKGDELAQKKFKTNLPIKIEEFKKKSQCEIRSMVF